jgi:hypothetical protein
MGQWQRALDWAQPERHFVQFYRSDEPLLNRTVGRFFWDGLLRGDTLVAIATPERRECLVNQLVRLGADVASAIEERQLVLIDGEELLAEFMVNGQPDWERFQSSIANVLGRLRPSDPDAVIRAYGEMVGILWQAGNRAAAIRLEEHWNRLLHRGGVLLFCGYPIDILDNDDHCDDLEAVLCNHTHVMPAAADNSLHLAVNRAMDELLGTEADAVRGRIEAQSAATETVVPAAEGSILWLVKNLPKEAAAILDRARKYYQPAAQA